MKLTRDQIRAVAQNAGFTGKYLEVAVAIAFAESGGDSEQYDPESDFFARHNIPDTMSAGRGSVGLWQIFGYEHPEFDGWDLRDPQVNACAANLIFSRARSSFVPWSTWSSGAYEQFLPNAVGAA